MKLFRKILFWVHLVIGLAAGAVIAIVAFTGAAMAFYPQMLEWSERDLRTVTPPSGEARPLSVEEIIKRVRAAQPETRPQSVVISSDPTTAVVVGLGRTGSLYVDPYSGEIKPSGGKEVREFFQLMLRWHRWLGFNAQQTQPQGQPAASPANAAAPTGEARAEAGINWREIGGSVVGIATIVFLALCVSGLYLWWPRTWNLRALKTISLLNFKLRGKARDWNWHNVIGLWSTPVLIVICLTGLVMAYRPIGDWLFKRPEGQAQGALPSGVQISKPEAGVRPLGLDTHFATAKKEFSNWETITHRFAQQQQRQRPPAASTEAPGGTTGATAPQARPGTAAGAGDASATPPARMREGGGGAGQARGPQAVTLAILEHGARTHVATQVIFDPYTGAVLHKEGLSDYSLGRALRTLNLSLHMGTAGGLTGQIVAFLACVGGLVLVYTGFALAWRRFFGRKRVAAKSATSSARLSPSATLRREAAPASSAAPVSDPANAKQSTLSSNR